MSRLLLNSGVLQFQGSTVQVIDAADTAADCTCCGPAACECPGGSFQTEQKRVVSAVLTIAGLPANYTETQLTNSSAVIEMSIDGLDAFNGSYNAVLEQTGSPLLEPDPCAAANEGCPFDDPKFTSCEWRLRLPPVALTGTYQQTVFSTTLAGWASISFASNRDPTLNIALGLAAPVPITGQDRISFAVNKSGIQSKHSLGTGGLLPRTGCETFGDGGGPHGWRPSTELTLVINGNNFLSTVGGSPAEPATGVYTSVTGTCGNGTGLFTPLAGGSFASIAVTSCTDNGGTGGAMGATFSFSLVLG